MDNKELMRYLDEQEQEIKKRELMSAQQGIQQATSDLVTQQSNESNFAKEQLDLSEDLISIYYSIRGYSQGITSNGSWGWIPPRSDEDKVFSEYGVHTWMNIISFYVNKHNLLTNYVDEKVINEKMRYVGHFINNLIMQEYEKIFEHPSFDTCKKELLRRIKKRAELKQFTLEVLGREVNHEQITNEIIVEMEPVIDKELDKIRQKLMQDKYKKFEMIMTSTIDFIHASMLRALRGEERASLRRHSNIMELRSAGGMNQENVTGYKGVMSLFKK